MSRIAPGKKPALNILSAPLTRYASSGNVLKQSEKNSDTTELCKVVHEAVTRHDNAPRRHYASHKQRRSFEHVEDCITGHFYILSQHLLGQPGFGVFLTSKSVGDDCEKLNVSQMIATLKDVSTAESGQDHILHTVSGLFTRMMNQGTYQKIASAILYCVPLIFRSGKSPSIFALPGSCQ